MPKGKRVDASEALLLKAGYTSTSGLRGSGYRDVETGRAASYKDVAAAVAKIGGGAEGLSRRIIAALDAKVPASKIASAKHVNYKGVIFNLSVPVSTAKGMLMAAQSASRIELVTKQRAFIANEIHVDKDRLLPHLQSVLQTLVGQIMDETIYDQDEVDVIYYDVDVGGRLDREKKFPKYNRTGALRDAAVEGVRIEGDTIHWSIDESFAPYWLWVDQGHRVFIPDGQGGTTEIGQWIVGRKFTSKIERAIAQIADNLTGVLRQRYKGVINSLGAWALHGTQYMSASNYEVANYPDEFGGYTKAFYQWVGVR